MYLDVVWSYQGLNPGRLTAKVAVIIDVLRATSTMVTALAGGCREVLPASTLREARDRAATMIPGTCLLGGEEGALRPPGFDLGNSPGEYRPSLVSGRRIILATTNGTRALQSAAEAAEVLIGCFLNGSAVAGALLDSGRDGLLVCAGRKGQFSPEDAAGAGMIAHRLLGVTGVEVSPPVAEAHRLYLTHRGYLVSFMRHTMSGANLIRRGLRADLAFCAMEDALPLVPRYLKGAIR